MGEISLQQIYHLAVEVSHSVGRLESNVNELLIEARLLKREMHRTEQALPKLVPNSPKVSPP